MSDVRLRPLRAEDLPLLHRWYQSPELWEHLVGDYQARREDEAIAYMRRWQSPCDDEVRLAIEIDGARLVGLASLTPIDRADLSAELHIFIGDDSERGRGVGRAAVASLLQHGFGELGLRRIFLRVLESNVVAKRVYDACGFRITGVATVLKHGRQAKVLEMEADQPRSATT